MDVTIYRDGKIANIRFIDGGKVESPLKYIGETKKSETSFEVDNEPIKEEPKVEAYVLDSNNDFDLTPTVIEKNETRNTCKCYRDQYSDF